MRRIYFGGTILTMEQGELGKEIGEARKCVQGIQLAEAVVTEDGIILAVGPEQKLRAQYPDADVRDLQGKVLLPAFLDAHSHFFGVASGMLQVSLEEAESLEEIQERLCRFVTENQVAPGRWVVAAGYDHNLLPGGMHPTRGFLDSCLPEHPCVLQHKSGHVGVFNSAALRELGVTAQTKAPEGGRIAQEHGELTGYMEENAFISYVQKVPMPGMQEMMEAVRKAQRLYASFGITTVQEGMAAEQLLPFYHQMLKEKILQLDLVGYPDVHGIDRYCEAFPDSVKRYDRNFKIGGIKTFLDGSPQGRTAWMRKPYAKEDSYCGYGTLSDEQLDAVIGAASEREMQLLAHCNGDAAAEQYIQALLRRQALTGTGIRRPVMVHAQLLGEDQMEAAKAAGILPSFFVAHVYHWGEVHRKNFGAGRAAKISAAASALAHGLRFTFHQDAPVIRPDMLETVWCAVNRKTSAGQVLGAEEAVTPAEALKAVTVNAAYQYFEEDTKGSIAPGKYADFVILDGNPLTVPTERIRELQVLATIRRDRVIYCTEKEQEL